MKEVMMKTSRCIAAILTKCYNGRMEYSFDANCTGKCPIQYSFYIPRVRRLHFTVIGNNVENTDIQQNKSPLSPERKRSDEEHITEYGVHA